MRTHFYVDNGLKSVPTVSQAISLTHRTRKLCANGGFNLHNFLSNKCEVTEAIPKEQRAKEGTDFDTTRDLLPVERALGVQ